MKSPYFRHEIRLGKRSGLITLATITVLTVVALLFTKREVLPTASSLSGLILLPAAVAGAVAVNTAWRLRPTGERGWLTTGLTIMALQTLAIAAVQLSAGGHDRAHDSWSRLCDLLVLVAITTCCALATHDELHGDPFNLGLTAGTALAAIRVITVTQLPDTPMTPLLGAVVEVCFVAVMLVALLTLRRMRSGFRDTGSRLALAGGLIATGQYAAAYLPLNEATALIVLLADGLGALVLTHATLDLLRATLSADRREVARLEERFLRAEEGARHSRAQIHEINATLAGISSASRLIRDGLTSEERRRRLELMMDDELARLSRLLSGAAEATTPPSAVPVDELLATLATAHEARGHAVRWEESGAMVLGRPDDVHEVLNILLDNAAKHGDGGASVQVTEDEHGIEIAVRDLGPGVAPGVDVFAWGQRGPRSQGQGIGLHIARELMEKQGGYLRLLPTEGPGATFVVGLPTAFAKERVR